MNQRTLKDVEAKVDELFNQKFTICGQTLSGKDLGYTFKFDNAKRRMGSCNYRTRTITLSKPICEANLDKIETKITDTILHELAHAFSYHIYGSEGKGHGNLWKSIAWAIGCDGNRCVDSTKINRPKSKYTLLCPNGCEFPAHRIKKRNSSCGKCSGGFYNPQFKLTLVQNY